MFRKFVAHKLARREKPSYTSSICAEPPMHVGLGRQRQPRPQTRIATRPQNVPELPVPAKFAGFSARNQVVAGAKQLEIVDVINDWYILRFQFPQKRRREVMVDVANMRYIGAEFREHGAEAPPRLARINRMRRQPDLARPVFRLLEIDSWH